MCEPRRHEQHVYPPYVGASVVETAFEVRLLQHTQDHTTAFQAMCQTIVVERIQFPEDIARVYQEAIDRPGSTLVIEAMDG